MKLHTNIHTYDSLSDALGAAKAAGLIPDHLFFDILSRHGSRSRAHAFEVRLGTHRKAPGDGRRWQNTGRHGANSVEWGEGIYAATRDEWGHFLARVFEHDTETTCPWYSGVADFHEKTGGTYRVANRITTG